MPDLSQLAQGLLGFGMGAQSGGALVPQFQKMQDDNKRQSLLQQIQAAGGINTEQGQLLGQSDPTLATQLQNQGQQAFVANQQQEQIENKALSQSISKQLTTGKDEEGNILTKAQEHQLAMKQAAMFPEQFATTMQNMEYLDAQQPEFVKSEAIKATMLKGAARTKVVVDMMKYAKENNLPRLVEQTSEFLTMSPDEQDDALTGIIVSHSSQDELMEAYKNGTPLTGLGKTKQSAGEQEFERTLRLAGIEEGSPAERDAANIKLGRKARATGSAAQTIAAEGTAKKIAKSQGIIKEGEKFAMDTGASRAGSIKRAGEAMQNIDAAMVNFDDAIRLVKDGADSGALEQHITSIDANSVQLERLQSSMALDVLKGVSLGAISAPELALVKAVGLPLGLEGAELLDHLESRRAAQQKLRSYYARQVQYLQTPGNTIGSFLAQAKEGGPQQAEQSSGFSDQQRSRLEELRRMKAEGKF